MVLINVWNINRCRTEDPKKKLFETLDSPLSKFPVRFFSANLTCFHVQGYRSSGSPPGSRTWTFSSKAQFPWPISSLPPWGVRQLSPPSTMKGKTRWHEGEEEDNTVWMVPPINNNGYTSTCLLGSIRVESHTKLKIPEGTLSPIPWRLCLHKVICIFIIEPFE